MAETVRQMVVKMSMNAGQFRKTARDIQQQIKLVDKELKHLSPTADNTGRRVELLGERFSMQKKHIEVYNSLIKQAKKNLSEARSEVDKLAKTKQLANLETELKVIEKAAKDTADEIERLSRVKNGVTFDEMTGKLRTLGEGMSNFGRKMSLSVTAPLVALGGKSYEVFKSQEDAFLTMQKTVEETDAFKFKDIHAALKEMSETQLPFSYEELMNFASFAGVMGVNAENIVKYVETIARLQASVDGLSGEDAAKGMAQLLTVVESSTKNIDKMGAAVVALGNNFPTIESEILDFSQRIQSGAAIVKMSVPEILGLSAGFSSMGIRAEMGGTAVNRILTEMQLAAEKGSSAMKDFSEHNETAGMSVRELVMAAEDSKWVDAVAKGMGRTKKEVRDMVESAEKLENFANITSTDAFGFVNNWEKDAAFSVLTFFKGLKDLGDDPRSEGIMSWLSKMDIDGARLAQVLQGASLNPQLLVDAIRLSKEQYAQGTALIEESDKRFSTSKSKDKLTLNELRNSAADFGENVGKAFAPVRKTLTELLKEFNKLDESTKDFIVRFGSIIAIAGPSVWALGKITSGIGALFKITKMLVGFPVPWYFLPAASGAAVFGLVKLLESLPTDSERIIRALGNIKINVDAKSKSETLAAIAEVREAAESLSGDKRTELEGVAAAVKSGYGTSSMFGQALEFSRLQSEKEIAELSREYKNNLSALNSEFKKAEDANDELRKREIGANISSITIDYEKNVQKAKKQYTQEANAYIDGMLLAQPEIKTALEQAAKDYDIFAALNEIYKAQADDDVYAKRSAAEWDKYLDNTLKMAGEAGYEIDKGLPAALKVERLHEAVLASMKSVFEKTNDKRLGFSLLDTIFADKNLSELLDVKEAKGAFDGLLELMDFKGAINNSGDNFIALGEAITAGMAETFDGSADQFTKKPEELKERFLTNFRDAFEIRSPSRLMRREAQPIDAGMAASIDENAYLIYNALSKIQSVAVGQSAAMAEAISKAFSDNLRFNVNLPNVNFQNATMPPLQAQGAAPTRNGLNIQRVNKELSAHNNRIARGYGRA